MWKNMKKRVEIVLKLATNGQSDKGFLLTSTFIPKGLSDPALGLYIVNNYPMTKNKLIYHVKD